MLDRIARELGLDRVEVRQRNLIGPNQMPYRTPIRTRDGSTMTYDSGDYPRCQATALAKADYDGFHVRQQAAREDGRHIGIGVIGGRFAKSETETVGAREDLRDGCAAGWRPGDSPD